MMVPEAIPLLLFVLLAGSITHSDEELIIVPEETVATYEGSSVTIPCSYKKTKDGTYTLLWFKDPIYVKEKTFNGTIVYSNTEERPQSPDYSSRVKYITDATPQGNQKEYWIKCDLRITNLQMTDSGNYSFRFIVSDTRFMSKALSLNVKENHCKVRIEQSELKNPLNESEEFTVRCSTSGSCDYPEWLVHTSGQKQEWTSSLSTDMTTVTEEEEEGRTVTKLKLKATWKDDNRTLSCRPGKSQDSWQIKNITLSVEYAPKETKATVSSEDVKEGDSVTLSCTSRGRPDVSFTWFKKGIKIENSQQMSDLKLTKVKPEDSGEYYCEAENKHGAQKSNIITINVKYGPKEVTVEPQGSIIDLKEGDKLTLKCSVKQSNPPANQFTWYNNNQVLQQTSETLTIINVTADDRGSYHCMANNGIETAESNKITISIKYSPRIKIEGTTSVKVGTPLTLTCSADADPLPHMYTWKHTPGLSSFPLSMETGQLNIKNMTVQHAGQYSCDVNNTIGTRSHSIKVDVLYPPSNLSLIVKREVREFEVMSIICTVQSFPESDLTMTGPLGDLRHIQNNRGNSTATANMLTVYLNVTESDAGMYSCNAKNKEGKEDIKQELNVLHVPKNVTVSIKGEQKFGSELILTCEARANPAPSSYEWKKRTNGELNNGKQKPEQSLRFHSLEISDSGQYVCMAHNAVGKTESPSVNIKVKYAPNINIVHNKTQGNNEIPVYLTCSADAYPPATDYKWYREDNTTVLLDHQNVTVQPQNPGMYYCTAANEIGKSRSEHIKLFIDNNSLTVFYQIILPIILLLILIVIAIFLIRRTIIKARSDQQSGADYPLCFFPVFLSRSSTLTNLLLLRSRNNTQEDLSVESIPDPGYGRVNQSRPTPNSQDPMRAQDLNPRPKSDIHTVYSAIKLPQMKQTRQSPKQQKTGYMDNGAATSTLNYVTLDFNGQNEPEKRVPEGSAVYAMLSKNKQTTNSQSENPDYENVSSACVPKRPFANMDWDSDTSEEDEVNYSTVSSAAKPAVKEPNHNQKSRLSSSSSDDEDRTEYSAIKT